MNENQNESYSQVKITRRIEPKFWRNCALISAGLLVAWWTNSDMEFNNTFSFCLLVVAIWFLNWIVRPVLVVFTLPFIIFTLGVGMLFINALVIYMASNIVPGVFVGSYWSALWASFLISLFSWIVALMKSEKTLRRALSKRSDGASGRDGGDDNDVIDV